MRSWWMRFYVDAAEMPHFEYHGPWWTSGYAPDADGNYTRHIICAAVVAASEVDARRVIEGAFDAGHTLAQWDASMLTRPDWTPFSDRFPREEWMRWPWPVASKEGGEGG